MTGTRLLVVAAVTALVAAVTGAPALAHNTLISSEPADGAVLAHASDLVTLTFLSTLDEIGTEVSVIGPDDQPVVDGAPAVDGAEVTVPVRPGPAGAYAVTYQVLSADGHVVSGTIRFTVTVGEPARPSPPPPSPSPTAGAAPSAAATTSPAATGQATGGSGAWWPWLLLGVLLLVAGAAGLLRRRRRSADQPVVGGA